jgi:hypothetical protein
MHPDSVARISKVSFYPSREKGELLASLGLPGTARWGDAAPLVKARIVEARGAGDAGLAAAWSEAQAFLKRVLNRTCAGCGVCVNRGATRCRACARAALASARAARAPAQRQAHPRDGRLPRPQRPRKGPPHVTTLCYAYVMSPAASGGIFQSVLCHHVSQQRPDLTVRQVGMSVRKVLCTLRRRGVLRGGGVERWGRFERV